MDDLREQLRELMSTITERMGLLEPTLLTAMQQVDTVGDGVRDQIIRCCREVLRMWLDFVDRWDEHWDQRLTAPDALLGAAGQWRAIGERIAAASPVRLTTDDTWVGATAASYRNVAIAQREAINNSALSCCEQISGSVKGVAESVTAFAVIVTSGLVALAHALQQALTHASALVSATMAPALISGAAAAFMGTLSTAASTMTDRARTAAVTLRQQAEGTSPWPEVAPGVP